MTIESQMYSYLTTHTSLKALVSTRVYPVIIPLVAELPAIAYQVLSDPPLETHQGVTGFHQMTVQFTVQDHSYNGALTVTNMLISAMNAWRGAVTGFSIKRTVKKSTLDGHNLPGAAFTRRINYEIQFHEGA